MKELSPGDTINTRYVIESVLGVGGMGVVYAAVQLPLSRRVALKIMGTPGSGNYTPQQFELAKKRFYREASLCAKLRHPNVLTVYDYGEVDSGPCAGSYFLATEYLSGQTLDARMLPGKGMPVSEVVATVIEIVRGLREAHRHGLVHRDLKPENVMLVPSDDGKDRVVILDFGLVRELDNDPSLQATQDNMICGTPRYIAPEQLAKKGPDPRSDLYSVGLIMYEALTGEYPYNTTNIFALLHSHVHQTVPKLREKEATRGVSGELEKLVAKLLEKDPEGRYQSAYDLLVDLRALPESAPTLSGILPKNSSTAQQAIILSTASQFQLGTKIAGTNNSIVYEATHIECGRKVVVKLRVPASPEEEARIIKTLPTLSMLRHPANVRVFDIGLAKSGAMTVPFLVMEYLRGESLSDRLLRKGKFTTAQVFSIGLQLTQALGEAHTFGLIHGNLDPDHIKTVEAAGEEVVKVHGYPMAPAVEKSLMSLIPLSTNISHYVALRLSVEGEPERQVMCMLLVRF